MSCEVSKMSWNEHGDPKCTITVEGLHDVYRLANHMTKGQCDFATIGFKMIRALKRKLTKGQWAWLMDYMHGSGGFR